MIWYGAGAQAQASSAPTNQSVAGSGGGKVSDAQVEAGVVKALAGAPALANQPITTTTVFGVVTLSGSVESEAERKQAEDLAARIPGVVKVVDELTLGSVPSNSEAAGSQLPGAPSNTPAKQGSSAQQPASSQGLPTDSNLPGTSAGVAGNGSGDPSYRQPYGGESQQAEGGASAQVGPGYGRPNPYPGSPRATYPQSNRAENEARWSPGYGGQQGGETVTIAPGALIRIRINETLDSGRTQSGTTFDGTVVNDVVAGGAVAIPRGAAVQGTVVDVKRSGVLAGRGEMSLQLTQVTLGGKVYPISSDVWKQHGGDKTIQSVNSTALGTGVGALFGAAAGGGAGAAIGAGVGGALGLGASASSESGQVYVPSEGMLTFHLAQPATVATVSQEEMNRLAQGAGPTSAEPRPIRRRYYPYPYYGPVYYRPMPYGYPYPYGMPYPY
ncbi:MAG: BON domain-containing protein [Acidobacteriota bacterium]|nr:BON domain-containing protein [Acidobacteriota bacterium]